MRDIFRSEKLCTVDGSPRNAVPLAQIYSNTQPLMQGDRASAALPNVQ